MATSKRFGKRKQFVGRMKKTTTLKTIGCSVAMTGLRSNFHTQAFMPPSNVCGKSNDIQQLELNKLWFRDGDDLDSEEIRNHHEEATSLVYRGSTARNTKKPVSTCLAHINSVIGGQRDVPREQRNIDDYLEFLDRRYNRLHSDETSTERKAESKKSMSLAWNWLFDESQPDRERLNQSLHEDALYVLGVAELASKRLLQKHHSIQNKKYLNSAVSPTTIERSNGSGLEQHDSFTLTQSLNKYIIQGALILRNFQMRKSAFLMSKTKSSIRLFMISTTKILHNMIVLSKNRVLLLSVFLRKTSSIALSAILSLLVICQGVIYQRIREI